MMSVILDTYTEYQTMNAMPASDGVSMARERADQRSVTRRIHLADGWDAGIVDPVGLQ
jgi:hypothetical protein